jgi:ectoine hydroxylase-related dioxygenase (phytanoyl-CoA dioxygenase family)
MLGALGPEEMTLSQEFEERGFVVIESFLTQEESHGLNQSLEAKYEQWQAEARQVAEKSDHDECDVLAWDPVLEGHPVFCSMAASEKLRAATAEVLGDDFDTQTSLIMFSIPHGRGQAWHQDCPPEEVGLFNLNRLLYPADTNLENGAIVVVPGSHKMGVIPPGGTQDPILGEVILTPRAGTLVLLHGHVYHRVTPNLTDRPRNSVNFRAMPAGVPGWITCVAVYRNGRTRFCDTPSFAPAIYAETP